MPERGNLGREALVEKILACVRASHHQAPAACAGGNGRCQHRVVWVYPYRNGGYQRYFCDAHLPPRYKDVAPIADADLYRLLDQLDELEASDRHPKSKTAWQRLSELDDG